MSKYPPTQECKCEDFQKNIEYLQNAMAFCQNHGIKYDDFDYIRYCPWCGKKLKKRI